MSSSHLEKKNNQVGSAYSRQQLPGKSAGLQASVRRVQLPDAFTEHPQLLVRPCVCSTERSTQLLGQLSLLREVVFWKKMYTAHVKASGKTSFTFLSVPHFLESKSCTRACAALRGSIALSKWKDSSETRKRRIEHKQWKVRLCTRPDLMFVLQYELSACFYLVMKIWSFLGFAVSYLQDSTKGVLHCNFLILFATIQSTLFIFICPEDIKVHLHPSQNEKKKKRSVFWIYAFGMCLKCIALLSMCSKTEQVVTQDLCTLTPHLSQQFGKLIQPGLIQAWACILVNRAN